jgi:hypothetical protein
VAKEMLFLAWLSWCLYWFNWLFAFWTKKPSGRHIIMFSHSGVKQVIDTLDKVNIYQTQRFRFASRSRHIFAPSTAVPFPLLFCLLRQQRKRIRISETEPEKIFGSRIGKDSLPRGERGGVFPDAEASTAWFS